MALFVTVHGLDSGVDLRGRNTVLMSDAHSDEESDVLTFARA